MQRDYHEVWRACAPHVYSLVVTSREDLDRLSETGRATSVKDVTWGTAFAVSDDGHFLTAHHNFKAVEADIISGAKFMALAGTGQAKAKTFPVKLVETYPRSDVALLKTDTPPRRGYIPLVDARTMPGAWVATFGYVRPYVESFRESEQIQPVNLEQRFTSAMVSGAYRGDGIRTIEVDKHLTHGNSGGPLVTLKGLAIGVVTNAILGWVDAREADTVATKVHELRKLVDSLHRQMPENATIEALQDALFRWEATTPDKVAAERPRSLYLPIQFARAAHINNFAEKLEAHGIPLKRDPQRYDDATDNP